MRNQLEPTLRKYNIEKELYEKHMNVRLYVDGIRAVLDQLLELDDKLKALERFMQSSIFDDVGIPFVARKIIKDQYSEMMHTKHKCYRAINTNLEYIEEYKKIEQKDIIELSN